MYCKGFKVGDCFECLKNEGNKYDIVCLYIVIWEMFLRGCKIVKEKNLFM